MKLIVLRGTSGAGKSTKARELAATVPNAVICSADDYFVVNGEYKFDPTKLRLAHEQCKYKAITAMRDDVELVIIDNTNTQRWEYEPYLKLAAEYGYETEVITVGSLDDASLELYAQRNTHGVPLASIQKMARRWED